MIRAHVRAIRPYPILLLLPIVAYTLLASALAASADGPRNLVGTATVINPTTLLIRDSNGNDEIVSLFGVKPPPEAAADLRFSQYKILTIVKPDATVQCKQMEEPIGMGSNGFWQCWLLSSPLGTDALGGASSTDIDIAETLIRHGLLDLADNTQIFKQFPKEMRSYLTARKNARDESLGIWESPSLRADAKSIQALLTELRNDITNVAKRQSELSGSIQNDVKQSLTTLEPRLAELGDSVDRIDKRIEKSDNLVGELSKKYDKLQPVVNMLSDAMMKIGAPLIVALLVGTGGVVTRGMMRRQHHVDLARIIENLLATLDRESFKPSGSRTDAAADLNILVDRVRSLGAADPVGNEHIRDRARLLHGDLHRFAGELEAIDLKQPSAAGCWNAVVGRKVGDKLALETLKEELRKLKSAAEAWGPKKGKL